MDFVDVITRTIKDTVFHYGEPNRFLVWLSNVLCASMGDELLKHLFKVWKVTLGHIVRFIGSSAKVITHWEYNSLLINLCFQFHLKPIAKSRTKQPPVSERFLLTTDSPRQNSIVLLCIF